MTALTQEVLRDTVLPSGYPSGKPSRRIVDDKEITPKELFHRSGLGQVKATVSDSNGPFITQWTVTYGGRKLGHINRSMMGPSTFYGYSEIEPTAMKGVIFNRIRDAIKWILLHARSIVDYKYHDKLTAGAYVEEAQGDPTPKELYQSTKVPKFVDYKSPHSGDEGTALHIPWPEVITPAQWSKISRIMSAKGYDSRGGADAQRAVYAMMQRHNNRIPPVNQDWIDAVASVLNLKAPSQKPEGRTAKATSARTAFARAIKEWGTTEDPGLAGYILPSGAMLDLSGGSGQRAYDHRQVEAFLDEDYPERSDAMHAFMDFGAIRWMPEAPGLDIRKPLTPAQERVLTYVLPLYDQGNIYLDVYSTKHGKDAAEYPGRTSPQRIIRDIATFYKTGELPKMSGPMQFHMASESAQKVVAVLLDDVEQLELFPEEPEPEPSPEEIERLVAHSGVIQRYEQIDGDYGDPWKYGGTWFSASVERNEREWDSIIHIYGLESEGERRNKRDYGEMWYLDKRVKKEAEHPIWAEKIRALWMTKYQDDEDDERARDEVYQEIADKFNEETTMTVYRTNAEDPTSDIGEGLASMLRSMGLTHEQWLEMRPEQRVAAYGEYTGWDDMDSSPVQMTKDELSKKLGIQL